MRIQKVFVLVFGSMLGSIPSLRAQEVYDSQPITGPRMSPQEAAASIELPSGFAVDLFAAEPDVQQPIGMAWDSRGRLWVAENYTYAEAAMNFDRKLNDRILIFQDADGDGKAEKRTVFWDQAKLLSSVEVGLGGVWALCPPNLLFIPDRNQDDIPDGPPEVVLDGFDADRVRHNLVNGLRWGPDGWLYGRHGILASSKVGRPDQADFERRELNCCVWRYHPQTKEFDVVSEGTTNPWGMDWDKNGHLFFINTVIGHLWHAIPGSHLQRMYGQDLDPHTYELLPHIADHVHWDEKGESWNALAKNGLSSATDAAGGGHAHVGMMIYGGSNWPSAYRERLYTLNLHGRRINQENMVRQGAGFVGKHLPDLFRVGDVWFRGIELSSGPDGAVYVLDWSDIGECHENDGVHRGSGRIYRLRYGQATSPGNDLAKLDDGELINYLSHADVWYRRMARQLLTDRSAAGTLAASSIGKLRDNIHRSKDLDLVLESLWTSYALGAFDKSSLIDLLGHENEHVRVWAIKLLLDRPCSDPVVGEAMAKQLAVESSDLVRLYAAGCIAKLTSSNVWNSIALLASRKSLSEDRDYPLVLWYGIKEHVAAEPARAIDLIKDTSIPKLTQFIARRISAMSSDRPEAFDQMVAVLGDKAASPDLKRQVLEGMSAAMRGRRKATAPKNWASIAKLLEEHGSAEVKATVSRLGVIFGQGMAIDQLRAVALDGNADKAERREALQSLVEAKVEKLSAIAWEMANDRDLAPAAMRSLSAIGSIEDAEQMVGRFRNSPPETKVAIIQGLAGNRRFADVLLQAVEQGKIGTSDIDAATLRQIQMAGESAVGERIGKLWPNVKLIAGNKLEQIQKLESELTAVELAKANLKNGRLLWDKHCATCHKLFGEGAAVGPELTGAQRSNLHYVLENVVEPSASVADRYRMTLFLLDDGQVISGVPLTEDDQTLSVQTAKEKTTINKSDLVERKASELSLMPDGLLDSLAAAAQRDLIGYVMSATQVR